MGRSSDLYLSSPQLQHGVILPLVGFCSIFWTSICALSTISLGRPSSSATLRDCSASSASLCWYFLAVFLNEMPVSGSMSS